MDYSSTSLIHFQAGNLQLALPMSQVAQIMGEAEVRINSKGIQPYGWISESDVDLPVIDIAACLGKPGYQQGHHSQFIKLSNQNRTLILLVEKVIRVRRPGATAFKSLPNPVHHLSRSLLLAAADEAATLFLLDFEGLAHLAGLDTKPSYDDQLPSFERKQRSAKASPSLLSFTATAKADALRWGLSTTQVAEVLKVDRFEDLPTLPNYFLGLLWWRQEPIPVVDLNLRMGKDQRGSNERVLIAKMLGHPSHVGLTCSGNMRLERDLEAYRDVELDPKIHPSFALAAFENENDTIVFPNIDAILA